MMTDTADNLIASACIIGLIIFGAILGGGIQNYFITDKYCKVMYSQTSEYARCVNTGISKDLERIK